MSFFVVLLGILAALLITVLGHSYWAWRRSRGPLRSSDDDVKDLIGSKREP
jgi:hypothetical protein